MDGSVASSWRYTGDYTVQRRSKLELISGHGVFSVRGIDTIASLMVYTTVETMGSTIATAFTMLGDFLKASHEIVTC